MKIRKEFIEKYKPASEILIKEFGSNINTAIIAGSGIAESIDTNKIVAEIDYDELSNLPKTSVSGHSGKAVLYTLDNINSIIFSGRFHYYEGRSIDEICSLVILSKLIGVEKLVITNAAGSLNPQHKTGDIMFIEDYIDFLFYKSNHIFFDENDFLVQNIKNNEFQSNIKLELTKNQIPYKEGVYAAVTGPNYETRAEIRMLRKIGADAVGMSTVPEIKAAISLNMNYLTFSLLTNSAKEVIQSVSHSEVIETAKNSFEKIRSIIEICIKNN